MTFVASPRAPANLWCRRDRSLPGTMPSISPGSTPTRRLRMLRRGSFSRRSTRRLAGSDRRAAPTIAPTPAMPVARSQSAIGSFSLKYATDVPQRCSLSVVSSKTMECKRKSKRHGGCQLSLQPNMHIRFVLRPVPVYFCTQDSYHRKHWLDAAKGDWFPKGSHDQAHDLHTD
jgi:hypothetical protein